ncbi:hypothetical protein JTE90_006821 [Oedothorax gibbosus]|uniref:Uncharacterized protein n=1 Tax=Oedothorax gibbosus TaxID=931172 RepID=A0AAV6U675_9ARAC|nr:hypothetical protein JTE90_006821 [Oedothorax gibbosus]
MKKLMKERGFKTWRGIDVRQDLRPTYSTKYFKWQPVRRLALSQEVLVQISRSQNSHPYLKDQRRSRTRHD